MTAEPANHRALPVRGQHRGPEMEKCGVPAGHHTPEDQPEAVASAISAWLDRHRPRTPQPNRSGSR